MKDVMLDFETLGNGKDKCLCQVGAVYFDRVTGELGAEYKANIDAASQAIFGARIDASTVYWWLQQSDAARASICAPGRYVTIVMNELNEFLKPASRIWSHATFDFVTLMDTFKLIGITPKFSYRVGLDLRTLVYLAGISTSDHVRQGTHHDALDDAKFQVKYAVDALNKVRANKALLRLLDRMGDES